LKNHAKFLEKSNLLQFKVIDLVLIKSVHATSY